MGRDGHQPKRKSEAATSILPSAAAPLPDMQLKGDVSALRDIFATPKRHLVGTLMPESLYNRLRTRPGGMSTFYEDAIAAFDGNLPVLLEAAARFIDQRRKRKPQDPLVSVNGRVSEESFRRLTTILDALQAVRGVSRAKVLAGLVQLHQND